MGPDATTDRAEAEPRRRNRRIALALAAGLGLLAGLTLVVGPSLRVEPGGRAVRFTTASRPFLPSLSVAITRRPDGKRALSVGLSMGTGR